MHITEWNPVVIYFVYPLDHMCIAKMWYSDPHYFFKRLGKSFSQSIYQEENWPVSLLKTGTNKPKKNYPWNRTPGEHLNKRQCASLKPQKRPK
jgi:hypothetical protein